MEELKATIKSDYSEKFKALANVAGVTLTGNKMIVEEIKVEELKTASGIVLATKTEGYAKSSFQSGLTHIALVLMVGEDTTVPGSNAIVKPGDIVWLAEFGVRPISNFPGMTSASTDQILQLTDTDQVHMVFDGLEAYTKALEALNGK
jgi:co-chaperonin GroES (HSP10)